MSINITSAGTPTAGYVPPAAGLSAPLGFTINTIGATGMGVTITPPASQNGAIGFRIYETGDLVTPVKTVPYTTLNTQISGLDPSTLYTFIAKTYDLTSESSASPSDSATTTSLAAWQMTSVTDSNLTMEIQYPLDASDPDLPAHARQSHALPGVEYVIPIRVKGGTPAHKYKLMNSTFTAEGVAGTDYPLGMTIGATYGTTASPNGEHGWVKYTPATAGATIDIYAQVEDQNGNVANVHWQITPGDTYFDFLDINGTGTDAGTAANPYLTFASWRAGSANKITYAMTGTYAVPGPTEFAQGTDTLQFLGYPGEVVNVDLTRGAWNYNTVADDAFVSNIIFRHMPHYNPDLATEANTSITEIGSTGVYTVNKASHGLGNAYTPTSITEDGSTGKYIIEGSNGLSDNMAQRIYITIAGAAPAGLNGTWLADMDQDQNTVTVDIGTSGLVTTDVGTCYWDFITLYDVVDNGPNTLNGDYAIGYVDANNFTVTATTGLTVSDAGNSAVQRANPKMVSFNAVSERFVIFDVEFTDIDFGGYLFNSNAVPLYSSGTTGLGAKQVFTDIIFSEITMSSLQGQNGGCAYDFYGFSGVIEEITVHNCYSAVALGNLKANCQQGSVRYCKETGVSNANTGWFASGFNLNSVGFDGIEMFYCSSRSTSSSEIMRNPADFSVNGVQVARCTYLGDLSAINNYTAYGAYPEANSNILGGEFVVNVANWNLGTLTEENFTASDGITTSSFIDYANGDLRLTDAALNSLDRSRGTVGHEMVAG
jgi:hypothetical protein